MTNLNLLFNKTYYRKLGACQSKEFENDIKAHNKKLFSSLFCKDRDFEPSTVANEKFLLKTVYPGLLAGIGMAHGSGKSDNDIRLGFSFDYVSGLPYIPGSTVKGVLKSIFTDYEDTVTELLASNGTKWSKEHIKTLKKDIFEGNKDVFFDAVVFDGDEYGRLMGPDTITSHTAGATKNPNPVLMIKVLPGVRFEFRFLLNDTEIDGIKLTSDRKKWLFKVLLTLFGIGAKTNTGYGRLEACKNEITAKKPLPRELENTSNPPAHNTGTHNGGNRRNDNHRTNHGHRPT